MLVILFVVGCSSNEAKSLDEITSSDTTEISANGIKITVYKSPGCGCCEGYVGELERNGYDVEVVETSDMTLLKEEYNIPRTMQSCHTAIVQDYFIEGHMPIEAIEKLLEEQPDIDGIALPGMPTGTPGMGGTKQGLYTIYSLTNGEAEEFMQI
ncbi:CopG family transcriptional regulator [Candidatus Woesearchaeota archaeon CG10_big_fil_rev_8_21_14_0_10_33_12]|nr:MAG: CopG family transcriptional regulator [Candidatus Woesearchaeota archaeon CG10_big_fil_rev_8_21_14_0_10_33_12]